MSVVWVSVRPGLNFSGRALEQNRRQPLPAAAHVYSTEVPSIKACVDYAAGVAAGEHSCGAGPAGAVLHGALAWLSGAALRSDGDVRSALV